MLPTITQELPATAASRVERLDRWIGALESGAYRKAEKALSPATMQIAELRLTPVHHYYHGRQTFTAMYRTIPTGKDCCLGVVCKLEDVEVDTDLVTSVSAINYRFHTGVFEYDDEYIDENVSDLPWWLADHYGLNERLPLELTDRMINIVWSIDYAIQCATWDGDPRTKPTEHHGYGSTNWMTRLIMLNDHTVSWSDAVIPAIKEIRDYWYNEE